MARKSKKEKENTMDSTNTKKNAHAEQAEQEIQESKPITESTAFNVDQSPDLLNDPPYAELNDKYLRLYSDFDNFRKRTLKEKIESSKYASADVIIKLLPVLDDFDRAIKAFEGTGEAGMAFKDGIVLIFNKFLSILNQQGLQQMRTTGETFDTDFHEAITNILAPSPEQKGKIVDEIEKGYLLNGRVIRYAKVVVGS
ncbi:MAG: nucleotide exchange factor GrpE [Bacteroidales bacterium]|nr:nucleotide exchange factor GrpE [Bacteroidales bacterium]